MAETAIISDSPENFVVEDKPNIVENFNDSSETIKLISDVNNFSSIPNSTDCPDPSSTEVNISENIQEKRDSSVDSGISLTPKDEPKEDDGWLDIMGSGNFKKLILKTGEGHDTRPGKGDRVTTNIKYFVNDVLIEEKENLEFVVGDLDVIQGLDLVICLMEKGEKSRIKIPAKLAYGNQGREPDIPPESNLECEVELINVQNINQDDLTVSDRLKLGDEKRQRGNYFYEKSQYLDAIFCYERAADYLEGIRDSSGSTTEESQKVVDMIVKVYNNMAASHLKLNGYQAALKSVESVLIVQPNNVKALFRKAKILGLQGSTDEAINCLKLAASLEPDTKIIQSELIKLKTQQRKEEESQKAMYKRMFPQSKPTQKSSSFSKILTISAITAGVMAVGAGLAAYRQFHS